MDHYTLSVQKDLVLQVESVLKYYDYSFDEIKTLQLGGSLIIRHKNNIENHYKTMDSFLMNEIFYKKKKNLHHYQIENKSDDVANFDISPTQILSGNKVTAHLFEHKIFRRFMAKVHNYGTFVRFSENKVQRLYWNPSLNAGIPLTAKEKDPIYELIFLLHDFGHFLLPDLIFTGKLTDNKAKKIYVNWRLLGESITVVLNEMLVVDYLKEKKEFSEKLKLDYDKPYKLYRVLKKHSLKDLFWASYKYFCEQKTECFIELVNENMDSKVLWDEFNVRYSPISKRGREWTECNFERLKGMSGDYTKWWAFAKKFSAELNFSTIEKYYDMVNFDDEDIMSVMFNDVWETLLKPLFDSESNEVAQISETERCLRSFKRYMVGNLFILIKYGLKIDEIASLLDPVNCK
jgi:hypothetical protein